jgi:hypothetical protein
MPALRSAAAAVLAVSVLAGCGGGGAAATAPAPFVIVLQDPTVPGAREVVSPAILALEQSLAPRGIEIRLLDASRTADVRAAAAEPSAWAAFEAPYTLAPDAVRSVTDAGLPVIVLSGDEPRPTGGVWRRFVQGRPAEARALSGMADEVAEDRPVCVAGEASSASSDLQAALTRVDAAAGDTVVTGGGPETAAAATADAGCAAAIWTGGAAGGADFREALATAAPEVRLLLGSQARTASFLDGPAPTSDGVRAVCACVDLSTTADPTAQAFVHGFQAATGLDPGPFAAEGADAGDLLVSLWDRGVRTPADLASRLRDVSSFRGLGGRYRWNVRGDLIEPSVRIYKAEGFRWLRTHPAAAGAGA